MNSIPTIHEDEREIQALIFEDGQYFAIGCSGVEKIEAYGEPRGLPSTSAAKSRNA